MRNYILNALQTHHRMLQDLEASHLGTLEQAAQLLVSTLQNNKRIYVCGNGGSAADAQHVAGELVGRFEMERRALPVVALTTDTSLLTALANDYSYEDIFTRQVEALVQAGDLLWAFSTSGSSANVVKAARLARKKEARILAFTGREGSLLEEISDLCLCADSTSSARSQEIHQLAYHILCGLVEQEMFKK